MTLETLLAPAQATGGTDPLSSEIIGLVDRVRPSVVQVQSHGHGGGAGVIWHEDGKILTNHHVVAGRGGPIHVLLTDGRTLDAEVVNRNPTLDLALLKVPETQLPAALVGDSSRLRIGELVFAVGHPWGQRGVVTAGIVSGLGSVRPPGGEQSAQYIRSDVRLAPGNSGGPLLNAAGEVIGINAMIFGGDLGVAIPSHVATTWVAGLPSRRAVLGVGVRPAQLRQVPRDGIWAGRTAGLLVAEVKAGGPADRAGLLRGDVLLDVDGRPVADPDALLDALAAGAANDAVRLHALRRGAVLTVDVSLAPLEPGA